MRSDEGSRQGLTTAELAGDERRTDVTSKPAAPRAIDELRDDADGRGGDAATPLLSDEDSGAFRTRWERIQTVFVDDPRQSTEQADALVAEVMHRLAQMFNDKRSELEAQWEQGSDVSTEDLRVALQRYRSFFERLLST
jgi:hypothetical protein